MLLRWARWVTDKYILLMLGLFPLFLAPMRHAYNVMTRTKFLFYAIATGLWLLAVIVLLVAGLIRGERCRAAVRPAHLAMAAFAVVGAVSAAVSEYGADCLMGAGRYDGYLVTAMYVSTFFGISLLGRPRRRYAWALGVSASLCCVVVILQLGGLDPLHLYPEGLNYYDKYEAMNSAFLGTLGNAGITQAFLCAAGPILTVYAVLSGPKADTFLLLPGALALLVILLCDVDAGVFALGGCVLLTLPAIMRTRRSTRIAAGISGGAAAAGVGALYFWPGSSGTVWELSQVLHGHLSDEFGSHRGQIWKECWRLFLEKPWLGGGPGTISRRLDIRWSRYIEALGRERTVAVDNAHNVYLGYLVNVGLLGALSYLAAAGCSLVTWYRRKGDAFFAALGAGFVCYMIQDFFGIGLCVSAPLLWVIWGLLESAPLEPAQPEDTEEKTETV